MGLGLREMTLSRQLAMFISHMRIIYIYYAITYRRVSAVVRGVSRLGGAIAWLIP